MILENFTYYRIGETLPKTMGLCPSYLPLAPPSPHDEDVRRGFREPMTLIALPAPSLASTWPPLLDSFIFNDIELHYFGPVLGVFYLLMDVSGAALVGVWVLRWTHRFYLEDQNFNF